MPRVVSRIALDRLAEQDQLLGTATDEEIARQLHRKPSAVKWRRRELHIPKFASKNRRYSAAEDTLLGTASDEEIARRLNRPLSSVLTRRAQLGVPKFAAKVRPWTPDEDQLLGTMPDKKLALCRMAKNATRLGFAGNAGFHR
jgi:hypothetical protein